MKKICNFCGNINFVIRNVQYIYKHADKFLLVNDVPCEECEFCGEQYFEAAVLKKIEREFTDIYTRHKKPVKEIRVPIDRFADL